MRPGHGTSRRLLLLLTSLVFMTSLLQPCLGCQEAPICRVPCCKALPSCWEAENVTCFCPHLKKLDIRAGDIPTSVKSIFISKVGSLTIDEDAIHDLHSLTSFSLHGISSIMFEKGGLKLHENTSLSSFNVTEAKLLHIDRHAFAGNWKNTTFVIFKLINTVRIEPQGFSYTAVQLGPRINVQNIMTLYVGSGAFDAFVSRLHLVNVNMPQCRGNTFNEKIDSLMLNNVTITYLEKQCFHYNVDQKITNGWRRYVAIKASTLGTVRPQAFLGSITSLTLEHTELNIVHELGFQVHVKNFSIIQSKIGTLQSKGLSITSGSTFSLRNVKIEQLKKNAFAGVWMNTTSHRYRAVSFDRLDIEHAKTGSLSLPDCLPLEVYMLNIQESVAKRCPTQRWARRLLGAHHHRPLRRAEFHVFQSLSDHHLCQQKYETRPKKRFNWCAAGRQDKVKALHEGYDDGSDEAKDDDYIDFLPDTTIPDRTGPDRTGHDFLPEDDSVGAGRSPEVGVGSDWSKSPTNLMLLIVLIVCVVLAAFLVIWLLTKKHNHRVLPA